MNEIEKQIQKNIEDHIKKLSLTKGDIVIMHRTLAKDFKSFKMDVDFRTPIIVVDGMFDISKINEKTLNKIGYFRKEQFELDPDKLADTLNDQYSKYKILTIIETIQNLTKQKDLIRVKEEK